MVCLYKHIDRHKSIAQLQKAGSIALMRGQKTKETQDWN